MQEIEVKLGPGQSIDQAILNGIILELGPEEISRRIGGILTPQRVMLRTRELLSGGNWLEDVERERAVIMRLEQILVKMADHAHLDDKMAKAVLAYSKELFARIDKRKAVTDSQLTTYDENVGRQIGRVVDLALTYMKGALRTEVDSEKWDELVQEALTMSWMEIEKKQVEG